MPDHVHPVDPSRRPADGHDHQRVGPGERPSGGEAQARNDVSGARPTSPRRPLAGEALTRRFQDVGITPLSNDHTDTRGYPLAPRAQDEFARLRWSLTYAALVQL